MTAHDFPTGSDDRRTGTPATSGEADDQTRLRFPGGRLGPADWTALARLSAEHSSDLRLVARGAVHVRGVQDLTRFSQHVEAFGLVARVAHPSAGTILASPLAGRLPGRTDLGELPERLATALAEYEGPAALAGHIVFGFDDGSGDVLAHGPDLAAVARPGEGLARIHVSGRDTGLETPLADTVSVLVDAAVSVVRSADRPARVPASGEVHDLVVVTLSEHPLTTRADALRTDTTPADTTATAVQAPPVGWVDTIDGLVTLLAVVPEGVVPARLAEFLGAIERPSTISADHVIGLHGLTEHMAEQVVRVLAPMGMVFDAASPWVEAARRES